MRAGRATTTSAVGRAAPARPFPPAGRDVATGPGRALQGAWLAFLAYGTWQSSAGADHPAPAPPWSNLLAVVGLAALAVTGGLLVRRRWALVGSAALALPLVALAAWCVASDAGAHWVAETALAIAVVGGSLHPASWRMHAR